MCVLISDSAPSPEISHFSKVSTSFNIACKELRISLIIYFRMLFKHLEASLSIA